MSRFFEKISFNQFKKDIKDDKKLYDNYSLPKRGTKCSAGYDFFAIEEFTIKPGEVKKVPTRSSMGFKYNVRMTNQIGIIETDYYNNENNEGHMWVALQNHGEKDYHVKKGEAYAQGIFTKFLTVDDEEEIEGKRKGGFGSTNGE